LSLLAGWIKK